MSVPERSPEPADVIRLEDRRLSPSQQADACLAVIDSVIDMLPHNDAPLEQLLRQL